MWAPAPTEDFLQVPDYPGSYPPQWDDARALYGGSSFNWVVTTGGGWGDREDRRKYLSFWGYDSLQGVIGPGNRDKFREATSAPYGTPSDGVLCGEVSPYAGGGCCSSSYTDPGDMCWGQPFTLSVASAWCASP